ncbi:MAG: tRNA N6-adenosine(37)-N6-threonylcarbamoyltransferase complex dimerization subunit TsaB [Bacillus thermozeamaize]|uniref:tRNA N6-adenosine(37)-N6-threonylcarbamoyltransferase complex dimerization subunit TsaB n=1 Tax=Bacillus thermozeamaize TaxID=230954 RepID=A0A1Y3PHH1_9BACI|nr:MAG: tRNA N6-adenosine(37)-N6-threonylcarbamoyltransferase complex dimerization subunit TsaB [Bacillus thermozeamaize]
MKILAMDTSTLVMGVAILDETHLLGEVITNQKKNHSVRLMPTVDSLLRSLGVGPGDLQMIAVAMGPGSYTGVRIGVTSAKMMAWALKIPLVGVSTLMGMAASLGPVDGWICPLIDARRGRVYTGLYRREGGRLRLVQKEMVVPWKEWVSRVLDPLDGPVWLTGDDLLLHQEWAQSQLGSRLCLPDPEQRLPRPSVIGRLALEWMGRADETGVRERWGHQGIVVAAGESIHRFVPQYLQKTEAEQNLLQKAEKLGAGRDE